MSRLIDADALMEKLDIKKSCLECSSKDHLFFCSRGSEFVNACEAIGEAPSIDLIRCKECRYSDRFQSCKSGEVRRWCKRFTIARSVTDDDYCSCGERSNDDES